MRKADYAALAEILKTEIESPSTAPNHAAWERAKIQSKTARDIARCFVARAHVDREEFLKACGLAD